MSLTQYRPLSFFIFACLHIYSTLQMVDFVCFAFFLGVILCFCLEKAPFCSLKGLTSAHSSMLTTEDDGQSWRSRPWIWRNGIGAVWVVRRSVKLRENQKKERILLEQALVRIRTEKECLLVLVGPIISFSCSSYYKMFCFKSLL